MTVRNLAKSGTPPSLDERIAWARTRVQMAATLLAQHPYDVIYRLSLASREAELRDLERLRR